MHCKISTLMAALLLVGLSGSNLSRAQREPDTGALDLVPTWTTGIISDGVGGAGIVVTDLTGDGLTDIVSCTGAYGGYLYVLNKAAGDAGYRTVFYSQQIGCLRVTTGDRDGDGIEEIFVGTFGRQVRILGGDTFRDVGVLTLPGSSDITGLGVADVDSDGRKELVAVTTEQTFVYDARTLALEWRATSFGGQLGGIGQIDNDPRLEIVINGNPAYVLDATNRVLKWAYSGGFGWDMAVGDVDSDNIAEIAYFNYSGIYLYEADTHSTKWHVPDQPDISEIHVGDANNDGENEVMTGERQFPSIRGWRGTDGGALWTMTPPEGGTSGMAVGDADNDGVDETVWGGGIINGVSARLYVANVQTQSIEWAGDNLDGPLNVAAADADSDGQVEVVLASRSIDDGYGAGLVQVYDGASYQLEWSSVITYGDFLNIYNVGVGQLDADPAREIVVTGESLYHSRIRVYDGITHSIEWQSAELLGYPPNGLIVRNIDADPVDEILIGLPDRVLAFDGATPIIQWDSGTLSGSVADLSIGDLDGNAPHELAVLTGQYVYVFDTATWAQRLQRPISGAAAVAVSRGAATGAGQLLVVTYASGTGTAIQSWAGNDYHLLWQAQASDAIVKDVFSGDFDGDGREEFALLGMVGTDPYSSLGPSLLRIGSALSQPGWLYESRSSWGAINRMVVANLDGDSQNELVFSSGPLIQVNEIDTSCPLLFSDVPTGHTFYPYVRTLACNGILGGYSTSPPCDPGMTPCFRPNSLVTRGQLSKIVSNSAGFNEPPGTQMFQDVPPGSTYYDWVQRLAFRGYISGYACGGDGESCVPPQNLPYFRPNAGATRGQLTKIVSNAAGFTDTIPQTQYTFADVSPTNAFWLHVERLLLNRPGVMGGYTCGGSGEPCDAQNRPYFRPNNPLTRGQTSKIVANTFFTDAEIQRSR